MNGRVLDRVEIANAALMEVGLPPMARWSERMTPVIPTGMDPVLSHRALLLAIMAETGPDYQVRCLPCSLASLSRSRCISIRDALRGLTCGRES